MLVFGLKSLKRQTLSEIVQGQNDTVDAAMILHLERKVEQN